MTPSPTTVSSPATRSRGTAAAAQEVFDKLAAVGIDLTDVFLVLENEGVEKFVESWTELLDGDTEAAGLRRQMTPER